MIRPRFLLFPFIFVYDEANDICKVLLPFAIHVIFI